ncbi:hypothetical protein [Clostridium celatum]|uniref:Uncharacterized protein n=1 Tax=Clostridium celatum DSM 1785 TaxID=545697 RepID=L1Q5D8_9CLOT|nr:hypothetical protein [Clostridium celatum]EKY22797.1 hypothetical protein HMPREF0216_03162 [Clostridium celatum DSM 1785]MCE9653887.1 hypothetical protein [Clostridium celatum]
MDKREYIKKYIDEVNNDESVSFIYWFIRGYIEIKENSIKMVTGKKEL